MPGLHRHCEGEFLASERAVDRSEYGKYSASLRQTSFEIPIRKYRQIIDFRNVLSHGYDLVDHRLVWSTIDEEIPVLLTEVEALLREPH